MQDEDMQKWFADQQARIYATYLSCEEPWKQSGFSGPEDRWIACRKPIADCISGPGSFLDIGCANGYLLECVLRWTGESGINIVPYGLDISAKLIELAKLRLPEYRDNLFTGNARDWQNPLRFDFIRTEIVYVPDHLQRQYIKRILNTYLNPGGKLIVCQYRSRAEQVNTWIDETMRKWGFSIVNQVSGYYNGMELTRAVVVSDKEVS
jgi:SAM-dependent methyltransferase